MKKIFILSVLVVGVIASGCNGGSETTEGATTPPAEGTSANSANPKGGAAATATAQPGDAGMQDNTGSRAGGR